MRGSEGDTELHLVEGKGQDLQSMAKEDGEGREDGSLDTGRHHPGNQQGPFST